MLGWQFPDGDGCASTVVGADVATVVGAEEHAAVSRSVEIAAVAGTLGLIASSIGARASRAVGQM
jgi:hypothetical protein